MARKYSTSFNNAPHTYQFYKDRRHDPRWHQAFIEVRRRRYIEGLLLIAAVLIAFILYTEFSSKANPEKTKINPTITHSTNPPATSQSQNSPTQSSGQTNNATSSSTPATTASNQSSSAQNSNAVSSSATPTNSVEKVQQALINKGYKIIPVLFDNEAIEQAINENKAPANFINDNSQLLLFKDAATVILKENAKAPHNEAYQVNESSLIIAALQAQIPYQFNQQQLEFKNWTTTETIANKEYPITWQLAPDPTAGALIKAANAKNIFKP